MRAVAAKLPSDMEMPNSPDNYTLRELMTRELHPPNGTFVLKSRWVFARAI